MTPDPRDRPSPWDCLGQLLRVIGVIERQLARIRHATAVVLGSAPLPAAGNGAAWERERSRAIAELEQERAAAVAALEQELTISRSLARADREHAAKLRADAEAELSAVRAETRRRLLAAQTAAAGELAAARERINAITGRLLGLAEAITRGVENPARAREELAALVASLDRPASGEDDAAS